VVKRTKPWRDPAVGKDNRSHLREKQKERRGANSTFREGAFVDVRMFEVRRDRDDWDDRGGNYGGRRARRLEWRPHHPRYYGIQGRTINVTDLLRAGPAPRTYSL